MKYFRWKLCLRLIKWRKNSSGKFMDEETKIKAVYRTTTDVERITTPHDPR
jgi:hypothetical protein